MRVLGRLVRNILMFVLGPLWWGLRAVARPRKPWILLRIQPQLVAFQRPVRGWKRLFANKNRSMQTSLHALKHLVERLQADPKVEGLLIILPPVRAGWATVHSARVLLHSLRASGKKVFVFLPRGGSHRELYLASAADRVLASPQSRFGPLGLAAQSHYVKPLLDKTGIGVEVEARSEYKTAAETVTNESMSEAQREQMLRLLTQIDDALNTAWTERGANLSTEDILLGAKRAIETGLIDGMCYEDALLQETGCAQPHTHKTWSKHFGSALRYQAWHRARWLQPVRQRKHIAVIPIHGPITEEPLKWPNRDGAALGPLTRTLRKVARNSKTAGVVLHIDSPGGSALASDLLHQEIALLARHKPVVACFGTVAASGGYYVAAPAHAIVAEPLTITGSIGVLMAKLVAQPLLERLGIRTETIRTKAGADMFSSARALTAEERAVLAREADSFYAAFVNVVAAGRGKSFDTIEALARGRVWSGQDAYDKGLVDVLGGLDTALEEVRRRLSNTRPKERDALEALVVPASDDNHLFPTPILPPQAQALTDLAWLGLSRDRALYYALNIPWIP